MMTTPGWQGMHSLFTHKGYLTKRQLTNASFDSRTTFVCHDIAVENVKTHKFVWWSTGKRNFPSCSRPQFCTKHLWFFLKSWTRGRVIPHQHLATCVKCINKKCGKYSQLLEITENDAARITCSSNLLCRLCTQQKIHPMPVVSSPFSGKQLTIYCVVVPCFHLCKPFSILLIPSGCPEISHNKNKQTRKC